MNLRRLQYFVDFAHRREADADWFDWESVRSHIAALEKDLGFALVHKKGPQARRLTPAGRHYMRDAQRILQAHQDMLALAAEHDQGRAGQLRIGLCEEASTLHFSRVLARFSRRFPQVRLDVVEGDSLALAQAVRRREVDLAMTLPLSADEGLAVRDAWQDPWHVALSPGRPLQARERITCEDLREEPLVLADPLLPLHGHDYVREAFRNRQIEPRIGALGINRSTMIVLAASGLGATFVPQAMLRDSTNDEGRHVPLVFRPFDIPALRICAAFSLNSPPCAALHFMQTIEAVQRADPLIT